MKIIMKINIKKMKNRINYEEENNKLNLNNIV